MKKIIFLFLLLPSGCVTLKTALRYGEQRYRQGRIESTQDCIEIQLRQFKPKLKSLLPFSSSYDQFEALADQTAKETDEKFKNRLEELGLKP